jgi:hypothetical protein
LNNQTYKVQTICCYPGTFLIAVVVVVVVVDVDVSMTCQKSNLKAFIGKMSIKEHAQHCSNEKYFKLNRIKQCTEYLMLKARTMKDKLSIVTTN